MARDEAVAAGFAGFPPEAFEFYEDLEADCSKAFWDAHKAQYDTHVRAPMAALMGELAEEFGTAKIFRPYRDVRFSHDKSPYKTHQGAYVPTAPRAGFYAEISAPGFLTGGGFYGADAAALRRLRTRIAGPAGTRLTAIVSDLAGRGWTLAGETVKTAPRGFAADHERIDLLRHKTMSMRRGIPDDVVTSGGLSEQVRSDWRELRPLVEWLSESLR